MSRDGAVRPTEKHPLMMVAIAFACLVALRAVAVVWFHSLARRWMYPQMESDIAAEDGCGTSRPAVAAYSDSKAVREKLSRTGGHMRSGHRRLRRRCHY